MTTKEIPFKRWINLTLTIEHNTDILKVKLYLNMDESFNSTILLANKEVQMTQSSHSHNLTKLMDRGLGRFAEVGVWDNSMNESEIVDLCKHGADTYGRISNN